MTQRAPLFSKFAMNDSSGSLADLKLTAHQETKTISLCSTSASFERNQKQTLREFSRSYYYQQRIECAATVKDLPKAERRAAIGEFYSLTAIAVAKNTREAEDHTVNAHPERYKQSGIFFDRTESAIELQENNQFLVFKRKASQEKTNEAEQLTELKKAARQSHRELEQRFGFISRQSTIQAKEFYEIFEQVVGGYNKFARLRGQPTYQGKIFLVDSAEANAFIHANEEDIYYNAGLIRDIARFSLSACPNQEERPKFTRGLLAAVMAHELAHRLQFSTYHGLFNTNAGYFEETLTSLLSLKKNAERDADFVGANILGHAGFDPREMLALNDYLIATTRDTVAEKSVSSHPHPRERKGFLNSSFADPNNTFASISKPQELLDAPTYQQLASVKHIGAQANQFLSISELPKGIRAAQSIPQLLELHCLAMESLQIARRVQTSKTLSFQKLFTNQVIHSNVYAFLQMLTHAHLQDEHYTVTYSVKPNSQGRYAERFATHAEEIADLQPHSEADLAAQSKKGLDKYQDVDFFSLFAKIAGANISDEQKEEFYSYAAQAIAILQKDAPILFDEHSIETPPQMTLRELVVAAREQRLSNLEMLQQYPLALLCQYEDAKKEAEQGRLIIQNRLPQIYSSYEQKQYEEVFDYTFQRHNTPSIYAEYPYQLDISNTEDRKRLLRQARLGYAQSLYIYDEKGKIFEQECYKGIADQFCGRLAQLLPRDCPYSTAEVFACLSEQQHFGTENDELIAYLDSLGLLDKSTSFRSPQYEYEHGLSTATVLATMSRMPTSARAIERRQDTNTACCIIREKLSDATFPTHERALAAELCKYNKDFRAQILRSDDFYQLVPLLTIEATHIHMLCNALLHHDDVAAVLQTLLINNAPYRTSEIFSAHRSSTATSNDQDIAQITAALRHAEKVIHAATNNQNLVEKPLAASYLEGSLLLGLHDRHPCTAHELYEILFTLSKCTRLTLKMTLLKEEEYRYRASADELMRGIKGRNETPLSEDSIPCSFFYPTDETVFWDTTLKEVLPCEKQRAFRLLFDLSLEQLQTLAKNQQDYVLSKESSLENSLTQEREPDLFLSVLNTLIIIKACERIKAPCLDNQETIGSENFCSLFGHVNRGYSFYFQETLSKCAKAALAACPSIEEKRELLQLLQKGFVPISMSSDESTDEFFKEFLPVPSEQARLFFDVLPLLCHVTVFHNKNAEDLAAASKARCSYLESLSQRFSTLGLRGQFYLSYTTSVPAALSLSLRSALEPQIGELTKVLYYPTIFRDGFLRHYEREILGDVFALNLAERLTAKHLTSLKDASQWIRSTLIQAPLEWQKLAHLSPTKIPVEQRKFALEFYHRAIPLCCDPQLSLRMGATAISLWRSLPEVRTFDDELRAITNFFPHPSELRDQELYNLTDGYTIGGRGVPLAEVQKALCLRMNTQSLIYHEYWTELDVCTKAFDAITSTANKQSRKELLLWALDPKKHEKPSMLLDLEDKQNTSFALLPEHLRWAPRPTRKEVLSRLLLGEQGLLTAISPQDKQDKFVFIGEFFDFLFPSQENVPHKTGIEPAQLNILKDIFATILCHYSPERSAVIIENLIEQEIHNHITGKEQPSFVTRLQCLFAHTSATTIKVAQILAEKDDLVTSQKARNVLGVLTHAAPKVHTIALVETVLNAGLAPTHFEIGPCLSVASMKQVHKGAYFMNGHWMPSAAKALKPDVLRGLTEDAAAGQVVATMLKEKHSLDISVAVDAATRMLAQESMLAREFDHATAFSKALQPTSPIKVPKLYSEREHAIEGVIFEEFVSAESSTLSHARLRAEFLRELTEVGLVHADLHRKNHLSTAAISYLIDLGLVAQLKPEDCPAVARIARGIFLKEPVLVAEGFSHFCAVAPEHCNLEGIRTALQKRSFSALLTDLGKVLLTIGEDNQKRDNLHTLLKGVCNARWLFPLDLLHAPATFKASAHAFRLTPTEKAQALLCNIPLVLQETARVSLSKLRESFYEPTFEVAAEAARKVRVFARQAKIFQRNTESHGTKSPFLGKRREEYLLALGKKAQERERNNSILADLILSLTDFSENETTCSAFATRANINPEVFSTFCHAFIYFYTTALDDSDLISCLFPSVSSEHKQKLALLSSVQNQSTDDRYCLAIALADLYVRNVFTEELRAGFSPFLSPILRRLADQSARHFVACAAIFYDHGDPQYKKAHSFVALFREPKVQHEKILSNMLRTSPYNSTLRVTLPVLKNVALDQHLSEFAWLQAPEIRSEIQAFNFDIVHKYETALVTIGESGFALLGCRHGFNEGGRITLKLYFIEGGEGAHLECSDAEAELYIRTGQLPESCLLSKDAAE
jgi:hypothetical protein